MTFLYDVEDSESCIVQFVDVLLGAVLVVQEVTLLHHTTPYKWHRVTKGLEVSKGPESSQQVQIALLWCE